MSRARGPARPDPGAILSSLGKDSTLRGHVKPGKQGLDGAHRQRIQETERRVAESLNLEKALVATPGKKWDYLVGIDADLLAVEIHPATSSEVKTIIGKKQDSLSRLGSHLRPSASVSAWYWLASGNVRMTQGTTEARNLAKNGIEFPRRLLRV